MADMGILEGAALVASAGGTIMSAMGSAQQGAAAKSEANFEATQMRQQADAQQAAAQQKAIQQNKQTAMVMSNAQAAAAASGGSATDPTVSTNMQTIAGEGRYRSMLDLYQGDAAAQSLNTSANAKNYSGSQAARAGNIGAFTTILSGASKMYDSYGDAPASGAGSSGGRLPWQMPGMTAPDGVYA